MELLRQSLQRRVRSIHHTVQRVLYNSDKLLLKSQLFSLSSLVIVDLNSNVARIPVQDCADSHRLDIIALSQVWTDIRVYWNDRYSALFEERKYQILEEPLAGLVNVGAKRQAVIKVATVVALEVTIIVSLDVPNRNIRYIDSNLVIDARDDCLVADDRPVIQVWITECP